MFRYRIDYIDKDGVPCCECVSASAEHTIEDLFEAIKELNVYHLDGVEFLTIMEVF